MKIPGGTRKARTVAIAAAVTAGALLVAALVVASVGNDGQDVATRDTPLVSDGSTTTSLERPSTELTEETTTTTVAQAQAPASTTSSTVTPGSRAAGSSERPAELAAVGISEGSGVGDRVVVLDSESGAVLRELYRVGDGPGQKQGRNGKASTPDTSVHDLTVENGAAWFVESGVHCGAGTIYRVPLAGGPAEVLELGRWPAPSPDGRMLAYVRPGSDLSMYCAEDIVVLDLETGDERVFSPPPGTSLEFAVGGLAWAPDSRRLAFAVTYERPSVAVLDTATASSQADAVVVDPNREAFPGCLLSPTWGPNDTLLMVGVEPYDDCDGGQGQRGPDAHVVALERTGEIVRGVAVPSGRHLRADASGRHLLFSAYDLGTVEVSDDGRLRTISEFAFGADW